MSFIQQQLHGSVVHCYPLVTNLTVGRSSDCDIVLDDSTVSAQHAIFECTAEGTVVLRDLKSTNGILINGESLSESDKTGIVISEKDHIMIGTHEFNWLASLGGELGKTLKIKKSWIPGLYYTSDK